MAQRIPEQLDLEKMDYLLSLVGKDEDTILNAMKEMVKNGEKVKNQEKEIDQFKDEVHYLKKTNLNKVESLN